MAVNNVFRRNGIISLLIISTLFINLSTCAYTKDIPSVDFETYNARHCYDVLRYYEMLYDIPQDLLFAIAIQETGKPHSRHGKIVVWPWSVNINGTGHRFDTKRKAIKFVQEQIHKGVKSIDIGLMQINILYHPHAFDSVECAFDIYSNIRYAAYFLRSCYNDLQDWSKAVARYHSAHKHHADKYHYNVAKIISNLNHYKKTLQILQ